jgi:hypothetical protein
VNNEEGTGEEKRFFEIVELLTSEDLGRPLLSDPFNPQQVVHRPVRPALDDSPGERGGDPWPGFQILL